MHHRIATMILTLFLISCGDIVAPTGVPTPQPTGPVVIVSTVDHDTPLRVRRELNVVVADWSDRAAVERLLVDLTRSFLDEFDAGAVVVFAWDDPSMVSVAPFNVGRAQLSRDGVGWEGDGLYLHGHGEDDGSLLLEIVSKRRGLRVTGVGARRVAVDEWRVECIARRSRPCRCRSREQRTTCDPPPAIR